MREITCQAAGGCGQDRPFIYETDVLSEQISGAICVFSDLPPFDLAES
jgi:hypothetical protein